MKNRKNDIDNQLINLDVIEKIQPVGGIHFRDEKYICTGNGYECCIHVCGYANSIKEFWLTYLTGISNVIVTMDVSTEDFSTVQDNLNKNIKEHEMRMREAKDSYDYKRSEHELQKNMRLQEQVIKMDDVVRLIAIRIYVADKTREKVDETANNIINHLSGLGYKSAVLLNENKYEWTSMFYTYTEQNSRAGVYSRLGQPVLSSTLARGNPFHFSSLSDEFGSYWGDTDIGGAVLFDPFLLSSERKYYNSVLFGNMGSGKSTTLKKLTKDQAIRGNYIRGFDITGEFTQLVHHLGGTVISIDGSDGIINPLEIFVSGENEKTNWSNHVSKMSTMYSYLVPGVDQYELSYFQLVLKDFYKVIGIYPLDESKMMNDTGVITGKGRTEYPVLSDFRDCLVAMKQQNRVSSENMRHHDHVLLIITNLVENFGNIFDGHTSIDNVLSEQILYFNLSSVLKIDSKVLNTILFNIFSLCWDNLVKVGKKMKALYDKRQIDFEDITRFLIVIDEAHRIVNANNLSTVQQIVTFMREARKYFGGIVMASQSVRDYIPEGSNNAAVDQIKLLFELSQYKIIMQQDTNLVPFLKQIFIGQLTERMIEQIPRLVKGEAILALSSNHSLKFRVRISEEEKILFAGGA